MKAVALPGDISNQAFCKAMVEQAHTELGGLDILVNNAGTMSSSPDLLDVTPDEFDRTMKTNVYALFWIMQAAIPLLQPAHRSSTQLRFRPTSQAAHRGLRHDQGRHRDLYKGMTKQLMEKGIRINAVAPGPFWTPIQPSGQPPEKLAALGTEVPLGRPGQPVEIAPVYVLLASQEGSYITGEIYGVTGGLGIA